VYHVARGGGATRRVAITNSTFQDKSQEIMAMAITKVWIEEGCTLCGVCADTCPDVFELGDDTATVKDGADFGEFEDEIKEAAESCPVEVIKYE